MKTRTPLASVLAGVFVAASGVLAHPASALPAKQYSVQESTRCSYAQGCPRMLRNAISHATEFCREEGGVLRGAARRDFTCEQRGIYCVTSGRIECRGRFDPARVPGQPDRAPPPGTAGLQVPSEKRSDKTCFDVDCNRYVSHAPGKRESGTHACPFGFLVVGVSGRNADVVCQEFPRPVRETQIETDTRREGLLACPTGMLVRGVSADRKTLLCARFDAEVGAESLQDESANQGIQVCGEPDDGPYWFVTGIDEAHDKVLCAPVELP